MSFRSPFLLASALFAFATSPAGAQSVDFTKQVEPILRRCTPCHNAANATSGLRLDEGVAALKGGYSGAAIVPGKASDSALIHRVEGAKGVAAMPPGNKRLAEAEVATLRRWIDSGAQWAPQASGTPQLSVKAPAGHWAFQPIRRPTVPDAGASSAIDALVLQRLRNEGLKPAPEADRQTLLRRASLDLTGLPPKPQELAEFLADSRPNAYERQIERLLASPHFGEKWARHWLDQARYADSDGYEKDWVRPWAWRYRHWVIDAINRDLPFDQFSTEQLAGDLLPGATTEQKVATGFHRMTLTNREGGVDNAQFHFEATVDRANTTASVWLGLTMGCAQCHNHKYDPITQKDYYSLFAFFEKVEETEMDAPLPGETGPWLSQKDEYRTKREALLKEYKVPELMPTWEEKMLWASANPGKETNWDLAWDCLLKLTEGGDGEHIMRKPAGERTHREVDVLTDHFVRNYHFAVGPKKANDELKLKELDMKLRALYAGYPQLSQAMALQELPGSHKTYLRLRGDYKSMGIEVPRAAPGVLPTLKSGPATTRLDFARWLFAPENPLTARVAVNRIWQELFGQGLVRTSDDFGTRGETPSHPELLDWLASEFRDNGWSRKALIRNIVTSSTYRQSSKQRSEVQEKDPGNTLLARQSRLRLPAELIRDSALAASGLLTTDIGGRSVRPQQPAGVVELGYGKPGWAESTGRDRYRRGVYIHFQRMTPYPLLVNFDGPRANVAACQRERSNTPLQALNLLNDPLFTEAAQAMAYHILEELPKADAPERLRQMYLRAIGREPQPAEIASLSRYLERQKATLATEPEAAVKLAGTVPPGVTALEAAAWSGVASIVFNLDEFITRE